MMTKLKACMAAAAIAALTGTAQAHVRCPNASSSPSSPQIQDLA